MFTHYDRFKMGNEDDDYTVTVSGYNGAAGDSSSSESSTKFSTQKNDLDNWWSEKCALDFGKYTTLIATTCIKNVKQHCR